MPGQGAPVTVTNSTIQPIPVASSGSGAAADQVQGNIASGVADSGSPVKIGGVAQNTPSNPAYKANGQRADLMVNPSGMPYIAAGDFGGNAGADARTALYGFSGTGGAGVQPSPVAFAGHVFNGVTWDRLRGDTNGVFTQPGTLPAGTDRSGSAATSSGQIIAANAARRGLNIQNVGANNIGINEFGGAAVIGGAGTYTLAPGASMNIRTNRAIFAIAATGATAFTATEF